MKFMLCNNDGTLKEVSNWFSETTKVTRLEGLNWPKILFTKDGVTGLCYECTDGEFNRFIRKYNLTVDQVVDGIKFLKSS